jgi:hypothetical protein
LAPDRTLSTSSGAGSARRVKWPEFVKSRGLDFCWLTTSTLALDESFDVGGIKPDRVQHTYGREKPLSTKAVDGPHAQVKAVGNLVFRQQPSHWHLIYLFRLTDAG